MRIALSLLAVLALAGCDSVSDDGPAWAQPGAVAVFDYTPGIDSLFALGPGFTTPYGRVPSAVRAVEMRVVASPSWRRTDRHVTWVEPGVDGLSRFTGSVTFPLDDEDVDVTEDGLRVTKSYQCTGNGWVSGSSGTVAFVRVPRTTGRLAIYGTCSNGPGATLDAGRIETVTVPAGTFPAVVVEGYGLTEWWSWDVGLVRLDVTNGEGVLQGRFERSAGA